MFILIAVLLGLWHRNIDERLPAWLTCVLILAALVFETVSPRYIWRYCKRQPVGIKLSLTSLPPSDQWDRRIRAAGRSEVRELFGLLVLAIPTGLFSGILLISFPLTYEIPNTVLFPPLIPACLGLLGGVLLFSWLASAATEQGQSEYRRAIKDIESPALAKSVELISLVAELKHRASSAESIVRDFDALFSELNQVTIERQAELTRILQQVEEGQLLNSLTKIQRDGLRAIFDQDNQRRDRNALKWGIVFAVISAGLGIIGGYLINVLYPT